MSGPWLIHHKAKEFFCDGTIDIDGATFRMARFTCGSNCADLSLSALSQLTNPVVGADSKVIPTVWEASGSDAMWFRALAPAVYSSGAAGLANVKYAILYAGAETLVACYQLADSGLDI